MGTLQKVASAVVALAAVCCLASCGDANRNADEWLSLSISGLAGMDAFAYSGQTVTTLPSGISYSPRKFSGQVVDHRMAKQSGEQESDAKPTNLLYAMQNMNKQVSFGKQPKDPSQVSLIVKISPEDALNIWKNDLTQQMEQISLNEPPADAPYKAAWDKELNRSKKALNEQLSTLKVNSEYEVIVDRDRMLPIMLHETSKAAYTKKGKTIEENRNTDITFSSFSSANSLAHKPRLIRSAK
ncbi:hypothetical protein [Paenibacillus protaetiae]|uniref:Uncharacterized protein n=1 Tax=Paenibacillus protaetiae TaxID=2509456 RepID=A0A4P6ER53_9BACL|nr:hypothetical protein [Paenibacillus protaetiae]QAY65490.1 hypothetical protein ET464_02950 [Paenibacillus protaetiae]